MFYRQHQFEDELEKSALLNVLEPIKDKKIVYPNILIAPLLGFVDDCYRLGYGNGLYDKTISSLQQKTKGQFISIGVAFEAQRFDSWTGHLIEESTQWNDQWFEQKNTKIANMRSKFSNNPDFQWKQLPSDKAFDYIVTQDKIYSNNN